MVSRLLRSLPSLMLDVSEISRAAGLVRPDDETWFEVTVNFDVAVSEGGLVAPI